MTPGPGYKEGCKENASMSCPVCALAMLILYDNTTNIKKITHPARPWLNCPMNMPPRNAPNLFPGETSFCEPGGRAQRRSSLPDSANNVDGGG